MGWLEHKVPPPIIMALCALGMWFVSGGAGEVAQWRLFAAVAIVVLGLGIELTGVYAFRKHRTTINPLNPGKASAVVQTGPYRFTRNPMYLGMAMLLAALSIYLGSYVSVLGVVLFVAYIQRFQILPEERILEEKLGEAYRAYKSSVRRWI